MNAVVMTMSIIVNYCGNLRPWPLHRHANDTPQMQYSIIRQIMYPPPYLNSQCIRSSLHHKWFIHLRNKFEEGSALRTMDNMADDAIVWWTSYIASLQDNYRIKICRNVQVLLCRCDTEIPPELITCGTFPKWCVQLKCPSPECQNRRKWSVCLQCINVIGKKKKMRTKAEIVNHSRIHTSERTAGIERSRRKSNDIINTAVNW
jgi:hypothetical protein